MEKLLSVEELAGWLGVSPLTVYSWAARRRLPVVKVGARLMFEPQQIRRWLRARSRVERGDPGLPLPGDTMPTEPEARPIAQPSPATRRAPR